MQPGFIATGRHTPTFQSMIDQTMLEIREVDAASGNNVGQEMIEQMVEFFLRPPPPKEYKNMEEFLLYRHMDAGLP
jgi:hypothetical protein